MGTSTEAINLETPARAKSVLDEVSDFQDQGLCDHRDAVAIVLADERRLGP